jgi:calcineurin-like phosphoesterase family protein
LTTWFTSDTHYWHYNIIEFCGRPVFPDTLPGIIPGWVSREEACQEMNEMLIKRYNEVVKPDDLVYHLGDFAFCGSQKANAILEQLPGRKFWILGNHDMGLMKQVAHHFEWVRDYYKLKVELEREGVKYVQPIVLCHFPILSWDNMSHGSWHLHGHCHGSLPDSGVKRIDVGVDCHNWYPISLERVTKLMALRAVKPVDHHGGPVERVRYA